MRRAICYCEPYSVKAGNIYNFKFIYTTDIELPKGAHLKLDMASQGRSFDWQIPDVNLQKKTNLIWAEMPNGQKVKAQKIENFQTLSNEFEFTLPSNLSIGESFTIFIGSSDSSEKNGNRAQQYTQRKRPFPFYIDLKGKNEYKQAETFTLDIKGNLLENLRIIVPSVVARNRRFDVIVRFEDAFGNLTGFAPEGTLIELSYENLRENLNWKLFIPETGFLTLPNLYLNEPGIYRIKLKNLKTEELFLSPPIKCFAETDLSLFWGLFHGESEKIDATDNIENCLRHFRDEKTFQFYATSCFDSSEETSNEMWKKISQNIMEGNEDERFTVFCGSQWVGTPKEEGVRQFIFNKDNKPLLRKKDLKSNSLKKLYKTVASKELMAIPTFTMGKKNVFDFADFNPEFEKVVEIYNAWGSSECSQKEGNPYPIKGTLCSEDEAGSIRKALNANCRFGFVAGGLDDRGIYEGFYDSNQAQYPPGLTAIFAKDQTRDSLLDALNKRACYATTGNRLILEFYIATAPMGSILSSSSKPGLAYNRYITGSVIGTGPIKTIEIIRNGKVYKTLEETEKELDFVVEDNDPLQDIVLTDKNTAAQFVYYYVRITQKDGQMAWSSPIWVELQDKPLLKKPLKKKEKIEQA